MNRLALPILLALAGCYTTRIGQETTAPVYEDRQWFTVAGLVAISDPAQECPSGQIAYATSRLSVTDVLIDIGMSVLSYSVGTQACSDSDPEKYAACTSGFAALGPMLLSARTVRYQCR
jgi:hypothetical protein